MNKEEKAGLIVCSSEMHNYLKSKSGEEMPPNSVFVIADILQEEIAFVVTKEDFIDFLNEKGHGWRM